MAMRRAERLFQIIQILRRSRYPVTSTALAEELEVSQRSVYRDIAELMNQWVPIRGEPGIGYVLDEGYDMPPLMLRPDELEAAVLGAQWVADRGDPVLAAAARDLLAKIEQAVPEHLRPFILSPSVGVPPSSETTTENLDLVKTRASIRKGTKIKLRYCDASGSETERITWPVILGYFEHKRMLAAWCEERQAFRHFRTDRIVAAEFMDEPFPVPATELRSRWQKYISAERDNQLGTV